MVVAEGKLVEVSGAEMSYINRHRDGGVYDEAEEPPIGSVSELSMFRRIKAALKHPGVPEFIDSITEREMDILAKHITIRLVRRGPKK